MEICHIPPGNPANFHTITIGEKAFAAHLAHGDLAGACSAACAELCDDGDECTLDDTGDCEHGCPAPELVDCDDGNECTADSCDAVEGCVNTPLLVGAACNDGVICSGPDICNANGECSGAVLDDCCLSDDDCSQDLCDGASCDLDTNVCNNDPVVCIPPDLCTVSECASDTGKCVDTEITCSASDTCNVSTGDCELPPGSILGVPLAITFTPTLIVDQLLVEVADAWLTDPAISLDIEITGINGGFAFHGSDLIDLIDTNVFSTDGTIAQTVVDWTADTTTQTVNEVYTVCVQVLRNTTELFGDVNCRQFGPF